MPYHSEALGSSWSDVGPKTQVLILALMRVAGGGFLATGLAMFILLIIPFRAGDIAVDLYNSYYQSLYFNWNVICDAKE